MNTSVNSLMNKKYRFWGSSTCFRYLMQFLYTGAISGNVPRQLPVCLHEVHASTQLAQNTTTRTTVHDLDYL